jgi:hypothetical protein
VKRVLIAAAAVAVLAGCTSPPNAYNLAWHIPGVHGTSAGEGDIPPTSPTPIQIAKVHGHDGVDIVATFSTNAARAKWAQTMAGDSVNLYRVDGDRWTMITTDKAGYRADAAAGSRDIADAKRALSGTIRSIGSSE